MLEAVTDLVLHLAKVQQVLRLQLAALHSAFGIGIGFAFGFSFALSFGFAFACTCEEQTDVIRAKGFQEGRIEVFQQIRVHQNDDRQQLTLLLASNGAPCDLVAVGIDVRGVGLQPEPQLIDLLLPLFQGLGLLELLAERLRDHAVDVEVYAPHPDIGDDVRSLVVFRNAFDPHTASERCAESDDSFDTVEYGAALFVLEDLVSLVNQQNALGVDGRRQVVLLLGEVHVHHEDARHVRIFEVALCLDSDAVWEVFQQYLLQELSGHANHHLQISKQPVKHQAKDSEDGRFAKATPHLTTTHLRQGLGLLSYLLVNDRWCGRH